jgi:hypothetical protein
VDPWCDLRSDKFGLKDLGYRSAGTESGWDGSEDRNHDHSAESDGDKPPNGGNDLGIAVLHRRIEPDAARDPEKRGLQQLLNGSVLEARHPTSRPRRPHRPAGARSWCTAQGPGPTSAHLPSVTSLTD